MSIFEALSHPGMVHAMAVHFPVVLAVLGVPLTGAYLFFRDHIPLRWLTLCVYLLFAASAIVAVQTGESARTKVPADLSAHVWEQVKAHEKMAHQVRAAAIITAIATALTTLRRPYVKAAAFVVMGAGSLVSAILVSLAGHYGGTLVYEHGVGVPTPLQTVQPRLDPAPEPGVSPASAEPCPNNDPEWVAVLPINSEDAKAVSFKKDVVPIFEEFCLECHKSRRPKGELDMTTLAGLIRGGEKLGASVIPGDPCGSPLVRYIRGELQPRMPEDEDPLTPETLHTIRMWISAGAPDN